MAADITAGASQYTTFGRTGLRVSTLGLGGAALGNSYGPVEEGDALPPSRLRWMRASTFSTQRRATVTA